MQSIKKAIVKRFVKLGQYAVDSLGGETKAHYISPKGLYSKSIRENGLLLQIIEDEGNKFVIPLQKPVELGDGDIIITDDKNYIKFNYKSGILDIKGDSIFQNNVTVNGIAVMSVSIDSPSYKTNGEVGTTGTFSTADIKTITVKNGIITSIA